MNKYADVEAPEPHADSFPEVKGTIPKVLQLLKNLEKLDVKICDDDEQAVAVIGKLHSDVEGGCGAQVCPHSPTLTPAATLSTSPTPISPIKLPFELESIDNEELLISESQRAGRTGTMTPKVRPLREGNPHGFWWDQPGAGKKMYKLPKNPTEASGTFFIRQGGDGAIAPGASAQTSSVTLDMAQQAVNDTVEDLLEAGVDLTDDRKEVIWLIAATLVRHLGVLEAKLAAVNNDAPRVHEVDFAGNVIEDVTDKLQWRHRAVEQRGMRAALVSALTKSLGSTHCELVNAILDSGASKHFAARGSKLEKERPDDSRVAVASGEQEAVACIGSAWPLEEVRRVDSFERSLVSVPELAKLVGLVVFLQHEAYAVSSQGGEVGQTKIGMLDDNNLYAFDFKALRDHCVRYNHLLPARTNYPRDVEQASENRQIMLGAANATHFEVGTLTVAQFQAANAWMSTDLSHRLYRMHQRWGHPTKEKLLEMHAQGIDLGEDVTEEQLRAADWRCPGCEKGKMTDKRYRKKVKLRNSPNANLRRPKNGEEITVDIVFRRTPSVVYKDDKGQMRGGFRSALVAQCNKSKKPFVHFLATKKDMKVALDELIAKVEIEMMDSIDFDGVQPKVMKIITDRESTLTSKAACVKYLEKRVKMIYTAPRGTNQTGALDNLIRRLNTNAAINLVAANLSDEMWNFAYRRSEQDTADTPTKIGSNKMEVNRSPNHRWYGYTPRRKRIIFGADANIFVPIGQREGGDKIGPRSKGGNGRFRHIGPATGLGSEAKGDHVFDLVTKRLFVVTGALYNESMELVREFDTEGAGTLALGPPEPGDPAFADVFEKLKQKWLEVTGQSPAEPEADSDLEIETKLPPEQFDDLEMKTEEQSDETKSSVEEKSDDPEPNPSEAEEEDKWADHYVTESRNESLRTIAEKFDLNLDELCAHNYHPVTGKLPRARARLRKGVGVNLPSGTLMWHELRQSRAMKEIEMEDQEDELIGRVFKRNVPGHGEYYGVVLNKASANKFQVIYSDYEDTGKVKSLTRGQIAKGLLPKDTGLHHVQASLDALNKEKLEEDVMQRAAMARYHVHQAHAAKIRAAELQADSAQVLLGVDNYAGTMPLWGIIDRSAELMKPELRLVASLAHNLLASNGEKFTLGRHAKFCVRAKAAFDKGADKYIANLVKELAHMRACDIPNPKKYSEAIKGEFAKYWTEAIQREVENLYEHGVFRWRFPEPDEDVHMDSTWAFKVKTNDKGQVNRFKARLAARGFKQIYGVDYISTMAPVGKIPVFRRLVAEMAERGMTMKVVDVRSAYLQADLDIKILMKPPAGVKPPEPGMVMELIKALYGTKQAGRCWHKLFKSDLLEWGFKPSVADPCLFTKISERDGTIMRVLLFVDDMAIFTDSSDGTTAGESHLYADFMGALHSKYETSISDDNDVFLGIRVKKVLLADGGGEILMLSMERYIDDVHHRMMPGPYKKVWRPSPGGKVSVKDCPDIEPGKNPDQKRYCEMIGILRWIERISRPDITETLGELGKVQCNPGKVHVERLNHLFRFVLTTKHMGIAYGQPLHDGPSARVTGMCDSTWASDPDTFSSRGGYVFFCNQSPIVWASFRLKSIQLSSCEAEFMACSQSTQEALWLRHLEHDLGYGTARIKQFGKWCNKDYIKRSLSVHADPNETPSTVFNDNMGAIAMTYNPVHGKRGRHIHVRYLFCRDHTEAGHVEFAHIPGTENVADILTKCLPKATHDKLACKLVHCEINGHLCDYLGKAVVGQTSSTSREQIELPAANQHYPRIAMDTSDFDTEAEVIKILEHRRKEEDYILAGDRGREVAGVLGGMVIDLVGCLEPG